LQIVVNCFKHFPNSFFKILYNHTVPDVHLWPGVVRIVKSKVLRWAQNVPRAGEVYCEGESCDEGGRMCCEGGISVLRVVRCVVRLGFHIYCVQPSGSAIISRDHTL
jgi:hypothetical protein